MASPEGLAGVRGSIGGAGRSWDLMEMLDVLITYEALLWSFYYCS